MVARSARTCVLAASLVALACSVEPPTGDFVTAGGTQGSADGTGTESSSATTSGSADATGSSGEASTDAPTDASTAASDGTSADASATASSDATASESTTDATLCGNGIVDPGEACDGTRLGDTVCTDLPAPENGNYGGGTLACGDDCSAFDESGCTWCGNGSLDAREVCEGNDLGGSTCVDAGWLPGGGGSPTCSTACTLDAGSCTGTMCGGALAEPPDGAGACPAPWIDTGSACHRDCPQVGMNVCASPIACPADRNCEISCLFNACAGKTIQCATGHACDITCGEQSSCTTTTIECPPDGPCTIACTGLNSCSGANIVCPTANYACDVTCESQSACSNLDVQCGDGPCNISCNSSINVCNSADLGCGPNACTATCAGNSQPTLACGTSCDCAGC